MRHNKLMRNTISILSAAVAAALATNAYAWVSPFDHKYVGKPLSVCDEGSFFVGGVPKVTSFAVSGTPTAAPQQLTIGQMYVGFQVPANRKLWPLVIMHGSGYTGACVESTPDGREGWFSYLVRHGIAVFNVDQPGRARSGFDRSVFHEAKNLIPTNPTAAVAEIPNLGGSGDDATWTSWYGHIVSGAGIVAGTMIPHGPASTGDPNVHPETVPPSEAHGDYPPAYPIPPVVPAALSLDPFIAARTPAVLAPLGTLPYGPFSTVGAIGPAPNPVNNAYLALEAYKYSVPNTEATLPRSTCSTCVPTTLQSLDTWGPRAEAELVERLGGAMISGHSQGTSPQLHTARILMAHGHIDMLKGIIIPEGAAFTIGNLAQAALTPTNMANTPFLMLNGDYRPGATRGPNRLAAAFLNSVPRTAAMTYVDMEDVGPQFNGQTHMNMLGTTNLIFMDYILDWAAHNIPNPPAGSNHMCGNAFLPAN